MGTPEDVATEKYFTPPESLMDCLLSNDEIKKIEGKVFFDCQPVGLGFELKVQQAVAKAQLAEVAPFVEAQVKAERDKIVKEIEALKLPYVPQRSVDNIQEACRREIKYVIKTGGE